MVSEPFVNSSPPNSTVSPVAGSYAMDAAVRAGGLVGGDSSNQFGVRATADAEGVPEAPNAATTEKAVESKTTADRGRQNMVGHVRGIAFGQGPRDRKS